MIFSVIVPFLSEERYIERCIKSLLDQDFNKREYEVIFVDNGSTDKSADIVGRFQEIALLREGIKGVYAARNKGLEVARGEIVAFTDGDCVVSADWLTAIYEGMKETGAAIAFGKCLFPGDNWGLRLFGDYENAKMEYVLGKCPPKYFFGCGRNMAVRSAVFKKFGNFSKSLFIEDTEFIQRCILRNPGTNVTYLNNARVTHMDITNIGLWFKKLKGYGRHSRHRNIPFYTPLNYRLKLQIYVYCCQLHHYDFLKKVAFFVLLICGDLSYKLGRLKHFFGRL